MPEKHADAYKKVIAAHFDAASGYDDAAAIQKRCAMLTAQTINDLLETTPSFVPASLLEFGCGTGFLTEHLQKRFPTATLMATDIAPGMVDRTRRKLGPKLGQTLGQKLGDHRTTYHRMDGEAPDIAGPFDLITSSLCLQWFQDRARSLAQLCAMLAPGGHMVVTTLLEGSLSEWVEACAAEDAPCGVPAYPSLAQLEREWPCGQRNEDHVYPSAGSAAGNATGNAAGHGVWRAVTLTDRVASAAAFLRGLRQIGATPPRPGTRPIRTATMRRAMRRFDVTSERVTYRIGIGVYRNICL